jgi:hypothetical protein
MPNYDYSNQELARHYFAVKSPYAMSVNSIRGLRQVQRVITNADANISEHFNLHGDLAGLRCRGIGPTIKAMLEVILEKGFDEARREFVEKRLSSIQASRDDPSKRRQPIDETPLPGWEGAVSRLEE